ncbi:MAG: hypothetical protein BM485_03710 [Desulfobulbaceae bacterium DB1]|nr:MAG: hypothetical protein BM485_03710 [Desulfobulbaceae bacterium DB1]
MGKKSCRLFLFLILSVMLGACAAPKKFSDITLNFAADPSINDDVLLPVDIVVVDRAVSESVLEIGPENWFGETLRDRLVGEEIQHVAIKGDARREVKITIPEGVTKVIIYADYENNVDRLGQQIVISPEKNNFAPSYKVNIKDNRMELAP